MKCRAFIVAGCTLAALCAAGAFRIEDAYVAPQNLLMLKLVPPAGPAIEFERVFSDEGGLRGPDGWSGHVDSEEVITLNHPNGRNRYVFTSGSLTATIQDSERREIARDAPRQSPEGRISPLAVVTYENEDEKSRAERYTQAELNLKWSGTGRLAFPFVNPNLNGALYAELFLLFLSSFMLCGRSRRTLGVGLLVGAVMSAVCLVWTGSRGAMLGCVAGLLAYAVVRYRSFVRSRLFWSLFAASVVVLALWFMLWGSANLMRGFSGESIEWSNRIRLEMWKAAPQMMVDAPGGWGFCGPGKAYFSWYQPMGVFCLTGSLMNAHLNALVYWGWIGRIVYLLAWASSFAFSILLAVRSRDPIPLSVVVTFAVMAWFNPVFSHWALWLVPAAAVGYLVMALWHGRIRTLLLTGAGAGVLTAFILLGVYAEARCIGYGDARLKVRADGNRVLLNGVSPGIWVVDDGRGALGGSLVGKDLRHFLAYQPHPFGVGYVKDLSDLPREGVQTLVLAGKAGMDWLFRLSEDVEARKHLPKAVVFISPSFMPSEIPEGVRKMCRTKVVVGEFAARYHEELRKPQPSFVEIVPGMEKYIMFWLRYALEG